MGLLDGILGSVLGGMAGGGGREVSRGGPGGFGLPADRDAGDNPLGSILGRLGGGSGVAKMALLALAFQLIQRNGGIGGLLDKFRNSGLGNKADSWVGTGANMAVSPDELNDVLGPDIVGQLASHFGISQSQASQSLAEVLPELVNQMTPDGQLPDNDNDLISDALRQLSPRSQA
jgi:uncharacterized protein YidB (DUF937 family)